MLFLNLESFDVRFVVPVMDVDCVLSDAPIAPIHGPQPELLGVTKLSGSGGTIPVLDLGILTRNERCRDSLGTRIVVIRVMLSGDATASPIRIGLRAEGVIGLSNDLLRAHQHGDATEILFDEAGQLFSRLRISSLLSDCVQRFLLQEFSNG